VTVVVLNYTYGSSRLIPCLRHVLAQRDLPPGGMDVWVVHNPPSRRDRKGDDWTAVREELAKDEFRGRVRIIMNTKNKGFAGGHNVAFREVRTKFVAIVNYDARPDPTWLARLLAAFDGPANQPLGAAASKLVFLPRYLPVELSTPGFVPSERSPTQGADSRELGVRVYGVRIDGCDVTGDVVWRELAYDEEKVGAERFRWTRPAGTMLVPVDPEGTWSRSERTLRLTLRLAADAIEPVELSWPGGSAEVKTDAKPADVKPAEVEVEVPPGAGLADLLNNVGSLVDRHGQGTDIGFRQHDRGQYDESRDVFAFCGAAVCFRTEALRAAGYFDRQFFMYYEDTDLSWRLWALGWRVRYIPSSVVRHQHSATLGEKSKRRRMYVDRNRLLTLTKNARAWLAIRKVLDYLLEPARLVLRALPRVDPTQRQPLDRSELRLGVRLMVVLAYALMLPLMVWRRRQLSRRQVFDRREFRNWEHPWSGPGH
jgi:GT2 family glycosyltransferase